MKSAADPLPLHEASPTRLQRVTGVILAGGRGSRMGQDKALAEFRGRPLIHHVLDALTALFDEVLIIGRGPGWLNAPGVHCMLDHRPGFGPLGGLDTALRAVNNSPIFLTGCDMPFLEPAAVRLVLAALEGYDVAVPLVGGFIQPLHGAYSPRCLPVVEAQMAAGRLSLRGLLHQLDTRFIQEDRMRSVDPDLRSLRSLNRPEDLRDLPP